MWTVLRQRNFGLVWLAGLISIAGDWAFYTAMPVFILDRTDSVFLSGLVWSFIALPQIFVGPFLGVIVDRHSRQRIMFIGNLAQAAAMAVLVVIGGSVGVWIALALVLVQSLIASITSPAENALLPTIVAPEHLTTANALNALNDNIGRIIGPFIGAALYAWIDVRGTALVNMLSFALAATLISLVIAPPLSRPKPKEDAEPESIGQSLRIASDHLRTSTILKTVFLIQGLISLADGPLTASLTAFIRQTLDRSASDVGLFFSMRGVAGVLGALLFSQFASRFREERVLIVSLYVIGVEIIALSIVRDFWLIIAMMIAVGPVFAALMSVIPSILQRVSEDEWRGRLFALFAALAGGIFAFSTFMGGLLADLTSPPTVMALSGGLYLVAATIALLRLPAAVAAIRGTT